MANRNTTVYCGAEDCVYNDEGICGKDAVELDNFGHCEDCE